MGASSCISARDALTPADQALGVHLGQQHAAIRRLSEAGHKGFNQWHAEFA
jgi:hypothetical protein